jgi:hypothetical protein
MNEKTLQGILNRNSIKSDLLINIAIILDIDLNKFKNQSDREEKINTKYWI